MRTLTLTLQSQVRWQGVEPLRECVTALGRLKDNLMSEVGEEEEVWIKAVEVAASVQRKYLTVEKLLKMELREGVGAMKLSNHHQGHHLQHHLLGRGEGAVVAGQGGAWRSAADGRL